MTPTFNLRTWAPATSIHFHFTTPLQLIFCHPCYIMCGYYIIYSLFGVYLYKNDILFYVVSCKFFPAGLCWGHSSTLLCVAKCIYCDCWHRVRWANRPHFILFSMDCFQLVSFFKLKALLFRSFSIHVSWYACATISLGRVPRSRIAGSDLQNNGTVFSDAGQVRWSEPIHTPPKYLDAADRLYASPCSPAWTTHCCRPDSHLPGRWRGHASCYDPRPFMLQPSSPQIHVHLELQNLTVLENEVFVHAIKLWWGHRGLG